MSKKKYYSLLILINKFNFNWKIEKQLKKTSNTTNIRERERVKEQ